MYKKFDDSSFSRSRDIIGHVTMTKLLDESNTAPLGMLKYNPVASGQIHWKKRIAYDFLSVTNVPILHRF